MPERDTSSRREVVVSQLYAYFVFFVKERQQYVGQNGLRTGVTLGMDQVVRETTKRVHGESDKNVV